MLTHERDHWLRSNVGIRRSESKVPGDVVPAVKSNPASNTRLSPCLRAMSAHSDRWLSNPEEDQLPAGRGYENHMALEPPQAALYERISQPSAVHPPASLDRLL